MEVSEIDVCIVSYAKTLDLKRTTEECIRSLLLSERKDIKFNVFVLESQPPVTYPFDNTKTFFTNEPFGYHRYLNILRKKGKAPYVVLCNSDLEFERGWATAMLRAMDEDTNLVSASPLCPETQKNRGWEKQNIHYGYRVREELAGWCIFQKREIYKIIGDLDEQFEFWFCDNDYVMELQKHSLKHALVSSSIVHHHEEVLGKTGKSVLDESKKYVLTYGQEQKFRAKWKV